MIERLRRVGAIAGRRLPDRIAWRLRYLKHQRRWPNLTHPTGFNEKVIWRELNDRRPILAELEGKLSGRRFAADRLPDLHLPEIVWTGSSVTGLAGVDLPDRWVLKPNNSTHRIVLGAGPLDDDQLSDLSAETADWLTQPVMWQSILGPRRPWVESRSTACLIVERFLGDGPDPPPDVKLFAFDGQVELILVREGPHPNRRRAYFDREWERLALDDSRGTSRSVALPTRRAELLRTAEELAAGIDFVRVDLYESGDEVWFGEFTPNPGWGLFRFAPGSFDRELGRKWRLPETP